MWIWLETRRVKQVPSLQLEYIHLLLIHACLGRLVLIKSSFTLVASSGSHLAKVTQARSITAKRLKSAPTIEVTDSWVPGSPFSDYTNRWTMARVVHVESLYDDLSG